MSRFPETLDAGLVRRLYTLGVQPEDVTEHFIRGAGPGGQKINKTSSTVWLRHQPTGIEARCQAERSQAANRAQAWAELCRKLEQRRASIAAHAQSLREVEKRRTRQKSRGQKVKMIQSKKHRARIKQARRRPDDW